MKQTFLDGKIVCTRIIDPEAVTKRYEVKTPLGYDKVWVFENDSLEEKAKEVYHKQIWLSLLNLVCEEDCYGNRPCDYGICCERCNTWGMNHVFAKKLKEAGLDYSFYAKYLD